MDLVQEMLKYSDYLYKRAFTLSGNESDADDLVQETYLSALISVNKGVDIQNIKSYLLGILNNKYNDIYRKKYVEKNINDMCHCELAKQTSNNESFISNTGLKKPEVANLIRRELAYLPKIYREVLIQYYIEKKSVKVIAANLNISSSAVMNRLDRGRDKVKEGVIKRKSLSLNSFNPDYLMLGVGGRYGLNHEPMNVITNMIEQNILILAYEKPVSINTISRKLGVPMVFAEEAVDKLVINELMKKNGSKVYTNFPIIDDEFMLYILEIQKKYVDSTFEKANVIFDGLIEEYKKINIFTKYDEVKLYLYALYSIFTCIHYRLFNVLNLLKVEDYPERINSGKWVIDFGYKRNRLDKEIIKIPHRLDARFNKCSGDFQSPTSSHYEVFVEIRDTYLGISPWHTINGMNSHDVAVLLYSISKEEKYDNLKVYLIPDLKKLGFITENRQLSTDIPVISFDDYEKIMQLNDEYAIKYMNILGDSLMEMVKNNVIKYPKHINPVSYKTQLISIHGIALTYAQKATEVGIINMKDNANYPVAIIVEKKMQKYENILG